MNLRFVTKNIHALLDYPVAAVLIVAPLALGLGDSNPFALWLGVATGVAALVLTLLTDHMTGVFRVLSYKFHLAVDAAVGVTFLTLPLLLGFEGLDLWFYLLNGAAVAVVVSLHKPEPRAVAA